MRIQVVMLHPIGAHCYVNGARVAEPTRLTQGSVVQLGQGNVFRFNHPTEALRLRREREAAQAAQAADSAVGVTPTTGDAALMSAALYNPGRLVETKQREEVRGRGQLAGSML